jgi:predicted  nucleic acid-binding Zn-ribbon protein
MKKYRVGGTGVHAITLACYKKGQKKIKGVTWFESLEDAKNQVLENKTDEINRLTEEKKQAKYRLMTIENRIAIMSKPLNLDVITDDYLTQVNSRLEELNDKIQRGESVF